MTKRQTDSTGRELAELQHGLTLLGITYDRHLIEQFRRYIEILHDYKQRLHLLSHRDYSHVATKHFLTSLMAIHHIEGHHTVCDIGAGAGFPSLPLKIVRPEIECTLFESKKKKAEFLRYVIEQLGLSKIEVIDERAEHFTGKRFDIVLLKAVGRIKRLLKTIDSLIAPQGSAIFYKSHRIEGEIKAAEKGFSKRGFQVEVEKLYTPIGNVPLALVIIRRS
jgi:16S rRNA (guanine527-N7)-methyltransferase